MSQTKEVSVLVADEALATYDLLGRDFEYPLQSVC